MKKSTIFVMGVLVALMIVALIGIIAVGLKGFRGDSAPPKTVKAATISQVADSEAANFFAQQRAEKIAALAAAVRSPGENHPFIFREEKDGEVTAVFICEPWRYTVKARNQTVEVLARDFEGNVSWAADIDTDGTVDVARIDGVLSVFEDTDKKSGNTDFVTAQGVLEQAVEEFLHRSLDEQNSSS